MTPLDGREVTPKTISTGSRLDAVIDIFLSDQQPLTVTDPFGAAVGQITITDALRALRG